MHPTGRAWNDLCHTMYVFATGTDYGRPVRKSTPTPKFLGTAEAYFVCHIGPHRPTFSDFFDLSLHWVFVVRATESMQDLNLRLGV